MADEKPRKARKPKPAKVNGNGTALVKAARRPSVRWSEEVIETILAGLRNGKSLRAVCAKGGMPDESTVREWATGDTLFADQYRRAREIGYLKVADEIIEIADTESDAAKARNRIDARKFILAKMLPKVFGDRIEVDNKGGIIVMKLDAKDMQL
jgi:hypothetical protein